MPVASTRGLRVGTPSTALTGLGARARAWASSGERPWLAIVVLIYAGLAVVVTRPLSLVAGSHVTFTPAGDQLWIMGILEWQRHALFEQPDRFFAGHFFYGSGNALFGSDLVLGFLPITGIIAWLTDNPTLAFSVAYIASFVLNALAMYAAAYTILGSRAGALVAGVVYAFGPAQLAYVNHPQFAAAWWVPLAVLFAVRFARHLRWTDAALALLMVWMQFVTCVHLGLHAGLAVAALAGPSAIWRIGTRRDWRLTLRLLAVGLAGAILFAPIVRGYLDFAEAWRAERHITEVWSGSAQISDYLSPSARLGWYNALNDHFSVVPTGERRIFPGFIPPVLALIGVGLGFWWRGAAWWGRRRILVALLVLAAGGVLLSLGPNWRWDGETTDIELPYRALYDTLPPLRAVRVAARFSLLAHTAIALLAAVGVAATLHRLRSRPRSALLGSLVLAGIVMLEVFPNSLPVYPTPNQPALLEALRRSRDGPVLIVPVTRNDEVAPTWLASLARSGPLVNGYSGHLWEQVWYFRDLTMGRSVTEANAIAAGLSAAGVRNVIVDKTALDVGGRMWTAVESGPHAEAAIAVDHMTLIRLRPPANAPSHDWNDLRADLLVTNASPSIGLSVPLILENTADRPWTPPGDSRVRALELSWIGPGGEVVDSFSYDILPPPFLSPGRVQHRPVRLLTPPDSGDYRLRGRVDGVEIFNQSVRVGVVPNAPFRADGQGLYAELTLRTPESLEAPPGDHLPLHVDALNTGVVAWGLSHDPMAPSTDAPSAAGPEVIRLGWRWFRIDLDGSEHHLPDLEGRIVSDWRRYISTPPGSGHTFVGALPAPTEPGRYVARISMLAELMAWFDIEPIEIRVVVTP